MELVLLTLILVFVVRLNGLLVQHRLATEGEEQRPDRPGIGFGAIARGREGDDED